MNVTDGHEFMLPRGEWKRLHEQLQKNKNLMGSDLKAKIEVGPDTIRILFDTLEGAVEWKFGFL
jgi:hypothetical protein